MDTVFDRIQTLVPKKHGGIKQFCDTLGIKQQTYSDWKAGRNNSLDQYVYKIAYIYKVPIEWLLTGKEVDQTYSVSKQEYDLVTAFNKAPWNIQESIRLQLGLGSEKNNADTNSVSA